jgi:hypothetical protein
VHALEAPLMADNLFSRGIQLGEGFCVFSPARALAVPTRQRGLLVELVIASLAREVIVDVERVIDRV